MPKSGWDIGFTGEHLNTVKEVAYCMVKEVHASHILVKTEKEAKDVKAMLQPGSGNFSELAKKFSICPSAKKGGDLGWFHRGQMVKPFENASFGAKEDEIVGPIKTEFGWHLIKILEQR